LHRSATALKTAQYKESIIIHGRHYYKGARGTKRVKEKLLPKKGQLTGAHGTKRVKEKVYCLSKDSTVDSRCAWY
jgi:hypothetical protein